MRSGVPWHIKVHPDVRENAREAARRAGMSVSQWLNTVIIDSTADEVDEDDYYDDPYAPPALRRRPRDRRPDNRQDYHLGQRQAPPQDPGLDLTAIADRIEGLTDEVERLARVSAAPREAPPQDDATARKLADVIARLDQRVETFIQEGRSATEALGLKVESVDRALASLGRERIQAGASDWVEPAATADWAAGVDQACDEIAQRQRELEGEIFPAAQGLSQGEGLRVAAGRARDDFHAIYDRLKQVSDQVEAFGATKMREAVDDLRNDLADIATKLIEASPRRAIETLESEVRLLASRVDAGMRAGGQGPELASVESGLAEVRDAIRGLTPAESLSGAVDAIRVLSRKIDQMAAGPQDPGGLQKLEAAIAGLRGIISHVASDDSLAALTAEVRTLSARVDAGMANAGGSDILRNLEQRIGTIADAIETVRISTTNVSSSTLENAVKSLADKIDRLQTAPEQYASGPDLGAMIGSLGDKIDRLHTAPAPEHVPAGPDLGAMIGSLGERIDRMQVAPAPVQQVNTDHIVEMISSLSEKIENLRASRGDSDILRQIEDRIGLLSHKLEASEAKLGNLDNIERGMKELLAYLENTRSNAPTVHAAVAAPPVENLAHDVIRTQESLEAAHGTIGDVVDRLAMIETGMRHAPPAPAAPDAAPVAPQISGVRAAAPMPGSKSASSPRTASRVDDVLPSDLPLEPGSGYPRQGAGNAAAMPALSAAERIAASKAMAEPSRTAAAETEPKASFITAARRAAQAAAEDETKLTPRAAVDPLANGAKPKRGLIGRHIKSIIVGASVAIIAAGMVHLAFSFLNSSDMARSGPDGFKVRDPAVSSRPMPSGTVDVGSSGVLNVAPPATPGASPNAGVLSQPPVTSAPAIPVAPPPPTASPERDSSAAPAAPPAAPVAPTADVTGAFVNQVSALAPMSIAPASQQGGRAPPLPAAIGSKILVTAAENGDVTAAYEIATRYSDGRGVPLNPEAAAIWFERASNGGVVPAMFRLGGLYEKGIGVKKDLNKARELYIAAANRGSAKAMHNLAVLYADGFDGKPDYAAAIQWFRKAGARGVPDSQYNLGVLYARGIGVEANFGESYRWFALAAQSGDQDAAQKRDDVAKRLDASTLSAVRAAVQSWAPEPQPDDAVTVKAPPGGWDPATPAAPAATPKGKAKRV